MQTKNIKRSAKVTRR